jgi:hypothetical protein
VDAMVGTINEKENMEIEQSRACRMRSRKLKKWQLTMFQKILAVTVVRKQPKVPRWKKSQISIFNRSYFTDAYQNADMGKTLIFPIWALLAASSQCAYCQPLKLIFQYPLIKELFILKFSAISS